jgi:hypothetical protein
MLATPQMKYKSRLPLAISLEQQFEAFLFINRTKMGFLES